ncbi:cyclic nucleotide-binding domain-containing protein 2-like isoform X3 [Lineus longissimus]|uniref:cyclic nucleotide-binding domain-containing protein 2-like isoform X3 n=1 Tax=Lineus longissimus TaxID=88925 RepID=UPI00315CB3D1
MVDVGRSTQTRLTARRLPRQSTKGRLMEDTPQTLSGGRRASATVSECPTLRRRSFGGSANEGTEQTQSYDEIHFKQFVRKAAHDRTGQPMELQRKVAGHKVPLLTRKSSFLLQRRQSFMGLVNRQVSKWAILRSVAVRSKRRDDVRLPRLKKQRFGAFDGRDGRPGYESPFKNRSMQPMARFRRAARLVQLILTAITSTRRENIRREAKLMSFYQLQDELGTTKGRYGDGLDFDPNYYKACRQIQISDQAKQILMMDPKDRVDEQRHIALVSLNQAVDAFGEFPIKMQQSLVRRGWYEHFEAKRVIIRQGHFAENFYFILSGTAVVTILSTNKKTGETSHNTVAFLKKGNSFGELALMYGGTRNATVTCKDDVELLAVGRDDFVDIFMHVDKDVEPDHIQFLRLIDIFDGWPIGTLPYADPKTCLFTYFRRGVIMCRDSINNEWIYVVKTGSCRVLKALQPVKADMQTIPLELRGSTSSLATPTNSPRKSETQEKQLFSSNRYLPPLKAIDYEAARESRLQHQAKIEKLYEERHKTQQRRVQFEKAKVKPLPNAKVYVQIQKLGPKETFGLTSIAFQMMEEPLSLILVSDGAECVLINKKFFLQHLSEGHHKYLRTSVQPYPTEDHLQQKLQDQVNWEAYKAVTFQNEIVYKKKLHDTLEL